MNTRTIRVLVVDDSAVIREMICDAIKETPGVEVAGTAGDGKEALVCIEHDRPDVITLDIQMPGMDGLETLDAILQRNPIPVIMVSSLTQRSADLTLEALQRGALDYVAKPENVKAVHRTLHDELLPKIRTIAGADVQRVLQIRAARDQRVAASRRQRRSTAEPMERGDLVFFGRSA